MWGASVVGFMELRKLVCVPSFLVSRVWVWWLGFTFVDCGGFGLGCFVGYVGICVLLVCYREDVVWSCLICCKLLVGGAP